MKKIYIILGSVLLIITGLLLINKEEKYNYINYNGMKLALLVEGKNVTTMPSGNYFLVNYSCENGTILTWDRDTSTLKSNNININDSCFLEFESSPKLFDLVNIGDYIAYTGIGNGDNLCSTTNQSATDSSCTNCNQCNGWNASQTDTDIYDNYGSCNSTDYKFVTYGWRVLYKTDSSVYIVSAGSPECVAGTQSNSKSTISSLNTAALKYCNASYLQGGECNQTTAHAFNGDDFYKFTSQYYGSSNARYLYNYNDGGTYGKPYCCDKLSNEYCGYNNTIIDNGGYYWFGSSWDYSGTLIWYAATRNVDSNSGTFSYGVRPVLKLDSKILATGGKGTMEEPYTISYIISFTIEGTEYQAVEGMTWGEWVDSEYNVNLEYSKSSLGDTILFNESEVNIVTWFDGTQMVAVRSSDVISESLRYDVDTSHDEL